MLRLKSNCVRTQGLAAVGAISLMLLAACTPDDSASATDPGSATYFSSNYSEQDTAQLVAAAWSDLRAPAASQCGKSQTISAAAKASWTQFRQAYNYHIQTFAMSKPSTASSVFVVAEPPLDVSAAGVNQALCDALGAANVQSIQRQSRRVGYDGWVEDVVVEVAPNASETYWQSAIDQLSDTFYGTSYGASALLLPAKLTGRVDAGPPELSVTATELKSWLIDNAVNLVALDGSSGGTLAALSQQNATGAWRSEQAGLVVLTIDRQADLALLRPAIREFTLETDMIIGGIAQGDHQLAIVGRARIAPVDIVPPLRVEEILTLARAAKEQELSQSYERTLPLAGKIYGARDEGWDWAPILLSDRLIDTEFGSLLNITDQMLKSWSQHGEVDYVDFHYPKPSTYPFDDALGTILFKKEGAKQVLFNWNTTGAGAVREYDGGLTVYSLFTTGALPVTYGSDAGSAGGNVQTGKLRDYEEKAYRYFATLNNPYLQRVVAYTAIYQMFHEFPLTVSDVPVNAGSARVARADLKVHVRATLDRVLAGQLVPTSLLEQSRKDMAELEAASPGLVKEIRKQVAEEFGVDEPAMTEEQFITYVVAADYGPEYFDMLMGMKSFVGSLNENFGAAGLDACASGLADFRRLGADNAAYDQFDSLASQSGVASLDDPASLASVASTIKNAGLDDAQNAKMIGLLCISYPGQMGQMLSEMEDLAPVRDGFTKAAQHAPWSPIKTASLVLSRNVMDQALVGGHNLGSTITKVHPNADIPKGTVRVSKYGDEITVEINPADDAAAHSASRIASRNSDNLAQAEKLIQAELTSGAVVRPVASALKLPAQVAARPGPSIFARSAARELAPDDAAAFLKRAAEGDPQQVLIAGRPDGVVIADAGSGSAKLYASDASAIDALQSSMRGRDGITLRFEDVSPSQAENFAGSLGGGGRKPPIDPPPGLASPAPGPGKPFWMKWTNKQGSKATIRDAVDPLRPISPDLFARLNKPLIAKEINIGPAKISPDGRMVEIDITIAAEGRPNPLVAEVDVIFPKAVTPNVSKAVEAVVDSAAKGEATAQAGSILERTSLVKQRLMQKLGPDAVDILVREDAGIIISEREAEAALGQG